MDTAQPNFTAPASSDRRRSSPTTPPSPFTDSLSSPTALSGGASTSATDLTSLLSETSKLSLETVKKSSLGEPPAVTWPYTHASALDDIPGVAYGLDLFLKSLMVESEEYCHTSDPKKERLYFATGFGLIQCIKALMSYEDDDLLSAIGHTKHGNVIANEHRKKVPSLPFRLAGYVTGFAGTNWVKNMTTVERHAELVYAESLFEKALLGVVYSGDWLAFIKEALNMRSTMQVYRQLGKYLEQMDAEALARGDGPEDKSVDVHFRSGVYLGVGMSHITLSLIPGRLATLVELFGYKGDRHLGLALLQKAGGWTKESPEPSVGQVYADMTLLIFHLFLSSFTRDGVDVMMAQKIVDWNLKRYPEGVFFLLAQGRLSLCRSQPARAIASYQKAMSVQSQYRNLHHISFWEMAESNLALWELEESLKCWRSLHEGSTWSKAVYAYGVAALLVQLGGEENQAEGLRLMTEVPKLRQRIAGKSIPLEKFAIARAPRTVIAEQMLPLVEAALAELKPYEGAPQTYGKAAVEFWDDWCLARHLEGACLRYIAYPAPDALVDPARVVAIPRAEAAKRSSAAFEAVFANGHKIELDHYIVYHAHFEYGRLLAGMGKHLEVNAAGRKGKYSLENELHMRTTAALEALDGNKRR
ncbi:hypothetical protein EDB84DRAFT_1516889 [Lactarius hengduanensis]|nr:hypothetical protein EDB84DRAFT_1516889 [Lactarius hengduanensis]